LSKYLHYNTSGTEDCVYKFTVQITAVANYEQKTLRLPVYWHWALAQWRLAVHSGVDTERQCAWFTGPFIGCDL